MNNQETQELIDTLTKRIAFHLETLRLQAEKIKELEAELEQAKLNRDTLFKENRELLRVINIIEDGGSEKKESMGE